MSHRFLVRALLPLALAVTLASPAAAQTAVKAVRIASGPADVLQWRDVQEMRISTVPTGTILDVILEDHDARGLDWYWVVLPPDAHGTRRTGWIRAILTEPVIRVVPLDQTASPVMVDQPVPASYPRPARPNRATAGPAGYLATVGGATYGHETSSIFGGAIGIPLAPQVVLTAELGRMQNIVSASVERDIERGARSFAQFEQIFRGQPVAAAYAVSTPAIYGLAGVRYWLRPTLSMQPYVDGGVGFANLTPKLRLFLQGRDATADAISLGFFSPPDSVTKAMAGAGAGVRMPLWRWLAVDVGYRYDRVFDGDGINVQRVQVGLACVF